MSYTITISGHIEGESASAKPQEEAALELMQDAVNRLPGLSSAIFSGQHTGYTNMRERRPQTISGAVASEQQQADAG